MKDLAQLLFSVPVDAVEAVTNLLNEECEGVEVRDADTNPALEGVAELVVWIPGAEVQGRVARVETLLSSLKEMGTRTDPWSWTSVDVKPEEWQEAYKRYFKSLRIGRHFLVQPSWEEHSSSNKEIVIQLDPGMAFGTGLHASTRLVIHAMERLAHAGMAPQKVLDLGCGTGILAIAAAKLWPATGLLAVDHDEDAVQACRENVERNGLEDRILIQRQEATDVKGTFNLVLANLSAETLVDLQPVLRRHVSDFGHLILSGVTADLASSIALLYCKDLAMEPEYTEEAEGWRALLLKVRG